MYTFQFSLGCHCSYIRGNTIIFTLQPTALRLVVCTEQNTLSSADQIYSHQYMHAKKNGRILPICPRDRYTGVCIYIFTHILYAYIYIYTCVNELLANLTDHRPLMQKKTRERKTISNGVATRKALHNDHNIIKMYEFRW